MSDSPVPNNSTGVAAGTRPSEIVEPDGVTTGTEDGDAPPVDIESPAKIIRIGSMVKQLLEEVRTTTLDEAARDRMRSIYQNSISELSGAMSPDLAEELDRLSLDFAHDEVPSDAELRVAQAQLVGWLEGLFHGIQAALVAQQMAAHQQLEGVRGQLPERSMPSGGPGYI